MRRPGTSFSQRGLLLVEAVLSAVVIALGLVFVSRGFGSQLSAVRTMETYELLLVTARERLAELEAERRPGPAPRQEASEGIIGEPPSQQQWRVRAQQLTQLETGSDGQPLFSQVTLTVRRAGTGPSPAVVLSVIWPTSWVPQAWF